MTTITFGKGKDAVKHVIPTIQVDAYLKGLANAGWCLSEITNIKKS